MFVFVLIYKLTNPNLFDLFSNKKGRNSGGLLRSEYDKIGLYLGPVSFLFRNKLFLFNLGR